MSSRATVVVDLTESDDCEENTASATSQQQSVPEVIVENRLTTDLPSASGGLKTEVDLPAAENIKEQSSVVEAPQHREVRQSSSESSSSPLSWLPRPLEERSFMETNDTTVESGSRSDNGTGSQLYTGRQGNSSGSEPVCRRVTAISTIHNLQCTCILLN